MGAWSCNLYGNDTTSDIKNTYTDNLKLGYSDEEAYMEVFRCNERTRDFLTSYTKGMLYWWNRQFELGVKINMPEDLSFYRADGSVLLFTITHEADIVLLERDDEDFSEIIKTKGWYEITDVNTNWPELLNMAQPGWIFSKKLSV